MSLSDRGPAEALLHGLIDYAGLFSPAALPMNRAADNYRRYLAGEHRAALGRFVCPAGRLGELADQLGPEDAWRVRAVLDLDPEAFGAAVEAFRQAAPLCEVDGVEARAESVSELRELIARLPESACFEIPRIPAGAPFLEVLAERRRTAKFRTGGSEPEAFPDASEVARFLEAAASARVPFKATAGLHHALPGEYPVNYEPDSPRAAMNGFLNLFLAAALAWSGRTGSLVGLLESQDLRLVPEGIVWSARTGGEGELVPTEAIRRARQEFALGYGSCSFKEPLDELNRLGWLPEAE
ncbi:MAG: hypothetical protein HY319_13395 [Armatimonadetes bacterium]|nr:hypothetical protein [Armatimonadota bacterium]